MAQVVRLRTRRQKVHDAAAIEAAELLRQLPEHVLLELPWDVQRAISKAIPGLHRYARPDNNEGFWPGGFTMLSRNQTAAVWNAIRLLPREKRPNQVRDAFIVMMLNIRQDTGEVLLTRKEIAEHIGCSPNSVSRIMSTLERMNVITRDLTRVDGLRGPGVVTYKVNPHLAWNGSLDVAKVEAETVAPPLLKLMQGGADK